MKPFSLSQGQRTGGPSWPGLAQSTSRRDLPEFAAGQAVQDLDGKAALVVRAMRVWVAGFETAVPVHDRLAARFAAHGVGEALYPLDGLLALLAVGRGRAVSIACPCAGVLEADEAALLTLIFCHELGVVADLFAPAARGDVCHLVGQLQSALTGNGVC